MSPVSAEHLFAGIPVADRDAAMQWYARLLGRPPDLVPNDREAAWRLTDSAWICLYADAEPPGAAPHTVLVSDLERSATFYKSLFGLSVLSEDREHGILRLGAKRVMVSIRKEQPYGTVDHFGVGVENFNKAAVAQTLTQRGLKPAENWQYGFYVKDPDGVNVQLL